MVRKCACAECMARASFGDVGDSYPRFCITHNKDFSSVVDRQAVNAVTLKQSSLRVRGFESHSTHISFFSLGPQPNDDQPHQDKHRNPRPFPD